MTPPSDSAFNHRSHGLCAYLQAKWKTNLQKQQVEDYLKQWTVLVDPFWSGRIYQNFPEEEYVDYRQNYWDGAFPTLLAVKRKYDPGDMFAFPQMISPAGSTIPAADFTPPPPTAALALRDPIKEGNAC